VGGIALPPLLPFIIRVFGCLFKADLGEGYIGDARLNYAFFDGLRMSGGLEGLLAMTEEGM
jgi:hypothetical protein